MGEGVSNCRNDSFDILKHVVVPETNDAIAFAFDQPGAGRVVGTVLATIDLDHQPFCEAQKVDTERADRRLKPPFAIGKCFPKRAAQMLFGVRRVAPQSPELVDRTGRLSRVETSATLPHTGGGVPGFA